MIVIPYLLIPFPSPTKVPGHTLHTGHQAADRRRFPSVQLGGVAARRRTPRLELPNAPLVHLGRPVSYLPQYNITL